MKVHSLGRLTTVTAAAATAVVLGTSSASAHFCYVNHMTPQAMAGAANSNGFATFGEVALEFTGLCPAGIQVLANAAGVSVGTPINLHAVMAGGAAGQGKESGGISHLDFDAIDAAFPDAVAACV
ncbi:MAG TPA: hypothetical protein VFR22_15930 [Nocardioidaceae bacterium]|nr:hypothetical protein [Nocardioidaceae bacterium]